MVAAVTVSARVATQGYVAALAPTWLRGRPYCPSALVLVLLHVLVLAWKARACCAGDATEGDDAGKNGAHDGGDDGKDDAGWW